MCRIIFQVKALEKHPTDDEVNAGQFLPGDVIDIVSDGTVFTKDDLGDWNDVLDLPGKSPSEFSFLLAPVTDTKQARIGPSTQAVPTVTRLRMWNCTQPAALKMAAGTVSISKGQEVTFAQTYFKQVTAADVKAGK